MLAGRRREGGEEEWAATGLSSLAPAKEMGQPALHPVPHPLLFLAPPPTCVDGGAVLPLPDSPCQLGSMFAMSISLSNGTGPYLPIYGPCALLSPRKQLGSSLQPPC